MLAGLSGYSALNGNWAQTLRYPHELPGTGRQAGCATNWRHVLPTRASPGRIKQSCVDISALGLSPLRPLSANCCRSAWSRFVTGERRLVTPRGVSTHTISEQEADIRAVSAVGGSVPTVDLRGGGYECLFDAGSNHRGLACSPSVTRFTRGRPSVRPRDPSGNRHRRLVLGRSAERRAGGAPGKRPGGG